MHAHQFIQPWHLASTWSHAQGFTHRRVAVVVSPAAPVVSTDDVVVAGAAAIDAARAVHWWTMPAGAMSAAVHRLFTMPAPHTLPERRSHFYPSRCGYLDNSCMSRSMNRL
jgi:hypothetical protein